MKLLIFSLLCVMCFNKAAAQDTTDSISGSNYTLNEIVVKGDNIISIQDGLRVTPTKAQRSTAVSGLNLLFKLQIPMLVINPATESATFNTGETVSYFINGIDASLDEIKALRPADIKNIEVLRNPQSLAFDGAPAVVNFIVRQYNYGGYVSATAIKDIFYDLGDFRLFAKYAQNDWTFQASGGMNYLNTSGDRTEKQIRYNFNDGKDIFDRYSDYYETHRRQRQYYGAIQGVRTMSGGGFLLLHAGWRMFDNPLISEIGTESFGRPTDGTSAGDINDISKSISQQIHIPYAKFTYFTPLPASWAMRINAGLSANIATYDNLFNDRSDANTVRNLIDEHNLNPTLSMLASKDFNDSNNLTIEANGSYNYFTTEFKGSNPFHQHLYTGDYQLKATYTLRFKPAWRLTFAAGMPVSTLKLKGEETTTDVYGLYSASLSSRFGKKHMAYISMQSSRLPRLLTSYTEIDRIDTDIDGTAGNTHLRTVPTINISATYIWLKSNVFDLSFTTRWQHRDHDYATLFFLKDNIIYNQIINSGSMDELGLTAKASFSLLSDKLKISPSIGLDRLHHSGIYPVDQWGFNATLSADYTFNDNFSCDLFFIAPESKNLCKGYGGYSISHHSIFRVSGTYSINNFAVRIIAYPFYKRAHRTAYLNGQNISEINSAWNTSGKQRIEISAIYTINFGRKVSHDQMFVGGIKNSAVR